MNPNGVQLPQVAYLRPNDLARLSELNGGRKLRDFEYFDVRGYGTTGHTELEFFRTNGQIEDIPGTLASTTRSSNMVTSGKFDEPFLLTGVGIWFRNGSTVATAYAATETYLILDSGKLEIEINNAIVYERTPISRTGTVTAYQAEFGGASYYYMESKVSPHILNPWLFCEEGITVRAKMKWSAAVTVTAASAVGVYLIGKKYFKN